MLASAALAYPAASPRSSLPHSCDRSTFTILRPAISACTMEGFPVRGSRTPKAPRGLLRRSPLYAGPDGAVRIAGMGTRPAQPGTHRPAPYLLKNPFVVLPRRLDSKSARDMSPWSSSRYRSWETSLRSGSWTNTTLNTLAAHGASQTGGSAAETGWLGCPIAFQGTAQKLSLTGRYWFSSSRPAPTSPDTLASYCAAVSVGSWHG